MKVNRLGPLRQGLLTVVLLAVIAFAGYRAYSSYRQQQTSNLTGGRISGLKPIPTTNKEIHDVLPTDAILAISKPTFVSATRAKVQPEAPMIAVTIGNTTHAYSLHLLDGHEIVNDIIEGKPIATTWCPLCGTAIVYSRKMDGETHEFGVSGKLWRNSLVMFDRKTRSLWSHFNGECLDGKLKGKRLEMVAAMPRVTWAELKESHPDAQVLSVGDTQEGSNRYEMYQASSEIGIMGDALKDDRLPPKQMVVGVNLGAAQKAYPFPVFEKRSVFNDTVGGKDLVVFRDDRSLAVAVYQATINGKKIVFPQNAKGYRVQDSSTGSTWNLISAKAIAGGLKGRSLTAVPSIAAYWFAWCDFYPKTKVFTEK